MQLKAWRGFLRGRGLWWAGGLLGAKNTAEQYKRYRKGLGLWHHAYI